MEGCRFNEGDTVTSAPIGGQQGPKSSVMAARKIDVTTLVEIHEKPEHF